MKVLNFEKYQLAEDLSNAQIRNKNLQVSKDKKLAIKFPSVIVRAPR
mgnify:CR=1 FL=1